MRRRQDFARRPCRAAARFAAAVGVVTLAVQSVSAALPADCTVTPRPASEFVLPTDPAADTGRSRLIVEDEAHLPDGAPAAAADVAAAQAFAGLYTACQNAGDLRRLTALYSDAMFQDSLAARMYLPVEPSNPLEALFHLLFDPNARLVAEASAELAHDVASPPVPLSPPVAFSGVRDARVLPDGRLGAVLMQDSRPTEFQIYVRVNDLLLLDERMHLH